MYMEYLQKRREHALDCSIKLSTILQKMEIILMPNTSYFSKSEYTCTIYNIGLQ